MTHKNKCTTVNVEEIKKLIETYDWMRLLCSKSEEDDTKSKERIKKVTEEVEELERLAEIGSFTLKCYNSDGLDSGELLKFLNSLKTITTKENI